MKKIQSLLSTLESKISHKDVFHPKISATPVGWHIEHSLLTMNVIIKRLHTTDPANYQSRVNIRKLLIFTLGKIPRGKAKAPSLVTPKEYDEVSLRNHIRNTGEVIESLGRVKSGQFVEHPYFGHLTLNETIRFLKIHTEHHLQIIDDIIRMEKSGT